MEGAQGAGEPGVEKVQGEGLWMGNVGLCRVVRSMG